jgi:hypothetical protein
MSPLAIVAGSAYPCVMMDTSPAPVDRDAEELDALRRAVDEAERAVRDGRVVPHERVRPWLLELARGNRTQRPKPE